MKRWVCRAGGTPNVLWSKLSESKLWAPEANALASGQESPGRVN